MSDLAPASGGEPTRTSDGNASAREGATTFAAGDRVAGRYRVVRFLARGGMGEVYEAVDDELATTVAMKTIRRPLEGGWHRHERFKREVLTARRVSHRNVCRVFDLGRHEAPDLGDPVLFLTMEYLEGETLADRLLRAGPRPEAEVLAIALQMASGLAAAHEAGVVHRDLKPGNVFLVRLADGSERVVLSDFGLAREHDSAESGPGAVSQADAAPGTPRYMAPEQLIGLAATPASDVFSLGLVLHETATGVLPYADRSLSSPARTAESAATKRRVTGAGAALERTIRGCIKLDPAARPTAREVHDQLARRQRARPRRFRLALVLAALAGGGLLVTAECARRQLPAAISHQADATVAVLGFRNLTGDPRADWIATALVEMLPGELGQVERLHALSSDAVALACSDLGIGIGSNLDPERGTRLAERLGADLVVTGAYAWIGEAGKEGLRLDARVSGRSGQVLAAVSATAPASQFLALVAQAGGDLRSRLGVAAGPAGERAPDALPRSAAAAQLYSEGVERLRRHDSIGARDRLEEAVAADPTFALGRDALAQAWLRLGNHARAHAESEQAMALAAGLAPDARSAIEARRWEIAGEWERAAAIHEALHRRWPGMPDHGLRLARALSQLGRPDEAYQVVATLAAASDDDPRITLAEASVADTDQDPDRAIAAAERVFAQAPPIARELRAEARMIGGRGYYYRGDWPAAERHFAEAMALYGEAGNLHGRSRALAVLAKTYDRQGQQARATRLFEEVLRIEQDLGSDAGQALACHRLAQAALADGDLDRALDLWDRSRRLRQATDDAVAALDHLLGLANVWYERGDLDLTRSLAERAFELRGPRPGAVHLSSALLKLARYDLEAGCLTEARDRIERSLAMREPRGTRPFIANSRAALIGVMLAEGRAGEAEAEARRLHAEDPGDRSRVLTARALSLQSRHAEARREIDAVTVAEDGSPFSRLVLLATTVRIRAATASRAELESDRNRLESALVEAGQGGWVRVGWEVSLALGVLERQAGPSARGQARLGTVEREARRGGFDRIADEAAAAQR